MDPRRGRLAKYAKTEEGKKTHSITTKVTEKEYREFIELAARCNLTPSEALRSLIIEELDMVHERIPSDPRRSALDTMRYLSVSIDPVQQPSDTPQIQTVNPQTHTETKVNKSISERTSGGSLRPRRSSGKRFIVAPYDIGGRVPCPICETWVTRSNVSRHMRELHNGASTEDVYKQYADKLNEMMERERAD
jgi:hypothetical protein